MHVRTLAASTAVAAVGAALVTAPAVAGGARVESAAEVVRYDAAFPSTATARVHLVETPSGRMVVTLSVTGLAPGRTYGAHAHVNGCGLTGAAAGPHWQAVDGPSTPQFANPDNEIWLDVTTDETGAGTSQASRPVPFSPDDRPRSVIIHALPTATTPTGSGTAGTRLACVTVAF